MCQKEGDQYDVPTNQAADSRHVDVDKLGEWLKVSKTAVWPSIVRRFTEKVAEEEETEYSRNHMMPWE